MRTTHPSDKIGALMMLMLPQWIIHRVDPWSPFWPFPSTGEEGQDASNSFDPPCAPQRTMDSDVSARGYRSNYRPREPTQEELVSFMRRSDIEVLCVLEGTDSTTGKLVQVMACGCTEGLVVSAYSVANRLVSALLRKRSSSTRCLRQLCLPSPTAAAASTIQSAACRLRNYSSANTQPRQIPRASTRAPNG
jgi:hypothetical protein